MSVRSNDSQLASSASVPAVVDLLIQRLGSKVSPLLIEAFFICAGLWTLVLAGQFRFHLPWTPVPVTAQTLVVLLIGATYNLRMSMITLSAYLVGGGLGLPFFAAGAAGWAVFAGPTGGYLLGFFASAFVLSYLRTRGWDQKFKTSWPLFYLGHTCIFLFGVSWLSIHVGWVKAFQLGFVPFLPGEVIKTSLAAGLLPWLRRNLSHF